MKETGILFTGAMALATVVGLKLQTRRIIKVQPPAEARSAGVIISGSKDNGIWSWLDDIDLMDACTIGDEFRCPYGVPGDRLWGREAWRVSKLHDDSPPRLLRPRAMTVVYEAGGSCANGDYGRDVTSWCPSAFPANAEERAKWPWMGKLRPGMFMPRWASRILLEITDVRVERLQDISEADAAAEGCGSLGRDICRQSPYDAAKLKYASLWEQINGAGSWDANPWVWAVSFRRLQNG